MLASVPVTVIVSGRAAITHPGGPGTYLDNVPYSLVGVSQGIILVNTFDRIARWRDGWPSGVATLLVVSICAYIGALVTVAWLLVHWSRKA